MSPIKKFNPAELNRPAYADQQAGHVNLGNKATPTPGNTDNIIFKLISSPNFRHQFFLISDNFLMFLHQDMNWLIVLRNL
jgi:hypothetical protein